MLRDNGYRNVAVLENGFSAWTQRKFPTEGK
jgi:rhodanese-related sulfurtransferase